MVTRSRSVPWLVSSERVLVAPYIVYILVAGRFLVARHRTRRTLAASTCSSACGGRPIRRHMHHAFVYPLFTLCTIIMNSKPSFQLQSMSFGCRAASLS
jgi:hypothetical protein